MSTSESNNADEPAQDHDRPATASGHHRRLDFGSQVSRISKTLVPPLLIGMVFAFVFTASFATALHSPSFHQVKIAVVGPTEQATELTQKLNEDSSLGLDARVVASRDEAESQIEDRTLYGAFVLATENEVVVASAASDEIAMALPQIFDGVLAELQSANSSGGSDATDSSAASDSSEASDSSGASDATASSGASSATDSAKTVDLAPLPTSDRTGSVGYFAMIGLAIGSYVAALMLNNFVELRLVGLRLAVARLVTLAVFAIVAPLPVLLIVDPILDALPGHFLPLWGFLALLVFAVAVFANALIHFFGVVGTALMILIVTVIGNPAAGGSVAWPLLPAFFRVVGPWTPNGAATEGIRNIVYFDNNALGQPVLTLCLYAGVGIVLTLVAAALRKTRNVDVNVTEAEAGIPSTGTVPLS